MQPDGPNQLSIGKTKEALGQNKEAFEQCRDVSG